MITSRYRTVKKRESGLEMDEVVAFNIGGNFVGPCTGTNFQEDRK